MVTTIVYWGSIGFRVSILNSLISAAGLGLEFHRYLLLQHEK